MVHFGMLQPCAGVGEPDSAVGGSHLELPLEPQPSDAAVACMAVEADLEGFSPGRVAAVGVRDGLAEGERAF